MLPRKLTTVHPGMTVLYDGDKLATVPDHVAAIFQPGDKLLVLHATGDVLHVPLAAHRLASAAVDTAHAAFQHMGGVTDEAIANFYTLFAARLADRDVWSRIASANAADVESARGRGRSITRLAVGENMRREMIQGLDTWRRMPPRRGTVTTTVRHEGWRVEQVLDGLGVIGFVFEGRPNVFADATGILRGGNTAVLRIGGDALHTAQAIDTEALQPALRQSGLPAGAVTLIDSVERAAGWALFSDVRLALAVARGSGAAVSQLGGIARQSGIPVSLHGTGGAWLIADVSAATDRFTAALYHSLDRKVCNTANVVIIAEPRAAELIPEAIAALRRRGDALGTGYKLHVQDAVAHLVPADLFAEMSLIRRASGSVLEPIAERLPESELGREWEWEATPEITLAVARDLAEAVRLFNTYSPRFSASLIASDEAAHDRFFRTVDAPFVGDGFTRWVDGQYALDRPELGLSNWQAGRLFGRGGVLSGDDVHTVRLRARQDTLDLHR